ncbi:Spy/CpxP family protein refolding chaperone [Acidisphaera rubrifaciens]|nr:Spy/CpxP family protein refolding chaperone [Acidisphaera rubrifaciens]
MAAREAGCAGAMPRLDHIEGRIAYMKAELGLTPQQLPAWDAMAAALRQAATHASEMTPGHTGAAAGAGMAGADDAWPQRMAAAAQLLSARADMLRALAGPARDLYAVLSPAQRAMADQMTGTAPGGV